MRILITGASGFIGSNTADYLTARGHEVLGLDNFSTGKVENFKSEKCDILHAEEVMEHCLDFRPEAIVHLAAQPAISTSWNNPDWDAMVNVMGTLKMLRVAKTIKEVKKFVFASTSAVYANSKDELTELSATRPDSPYGVSKLAAEGYVRNLFPKGYVILRLGNVFGPRQVPIGENQVIPRAIKYLLYGDDFCIHGDGEQVRDFIYVKDVADAIEESCTREEIGTFNIGTGISQSVNSILTILANVYGRLMREFHNRDLYEHEIKWIHSDQNDDRRCWLDVSQAIKHLEFECHYGWSEGLSETFDWWMKK